MAITEGPPILAAGMSLDGSLIALQRSPARLEFVSCKSHNIFVQVPVFLFALACLAFVINVCMSVNCCLKRQARLDCASGISRRMSDQSETHFWHQAQRHLL